MEIKVTLDATPQFLTVLQGLVKAFVPGAIGNGSLVHSNGNGNGAAHVNGSAKKQEPAKVAEAGKDEAPAAAVATDVKAEAKAVTLEEIRASVQAKSQAGKREQIKTVLAEFGADKVTNLSKDQYSAFHQKIEAL